MMNRWLLAFLTAIALVVAPASGAAAMEEWCESDPLVLVTTPGGSVVPVYVTIGVLGAQYLPAVPLAKLTPTVKSVDGGRATSVRISVTVPGDLFPKRFKTRATASSGPLKTGTIYDTATGTSGQTMSLSFKLNTP